MLLARNPRGQLAFCISLFLALAVFLLGMLSYEISEYFLAQQELQAVAQAAALTCSTKLASLTSPDSSTSQNDAFATGTSIFQGNSVLGNSLAGAMQTSPSDPPSPLAQGQATICFQLLDPNTFQPANSPNQGTGAIVQATARYGYLPTFGQIFSVAFAPLQIACIANSGVQQLDLIIALDLSGGMDDETPVTLVQRYWDYDNNYPPHHIVYMLPAINGDSSNPAQGRLGSISKFEAPHLNGLWPQDLEIASSEPSDSQYDQYFSDIPGSQTIPLRSAGITDALNPPGNFNLAYIGNNGPGTGGSGPGTGGPGSGGTTNSNPALQADLDNIASLVALIDTSYTWDYNGGNAENGQNPWYYTSTGTWGAIPSSPPFTNPTPQQYPAQLAWYMEDAITVRGSTVGQVIESINAGNFRAGASAVCGVNTLAWQTSPSPPPSPGMAFLLQFSLRPGPAPPITGIAPPVIPASDNSGGAPIMPFGYWRYGFYFASGSAASNKNEIIVPAGTPGPTSGPPNFQPSAAWGPNQYNVFTDLVVNIDGKDQFTGLGPGPIFNSGGGISPPPGAIAANPFAPNFFTYNGYRFPSLGAVVEAARGNLESDAASLAAGLDLSALDVSTQAGYQNAYQQAALAQLQPLSCVRQTLPGFMSDISEFGNVNLGLITFNDDAGTSPTQTFSDSDVSPIYPKGGTGLFRLPAISVAANNTATINSAMQGLVVGGGRNVARSIQAALTAFANQGRPDSQKAIVLITDGPPTVDLSGQQNSASAFADARSQAAIARAQGVAIYCISIAENSQSQTDEAAIYNDTNRDTSAGGLAAISGHGAKFYELQYTDANSTKTALVKTFGNVTRQLNSLMINWQQVALQH